MEPAEMEAALLPAKYLESENAARSLANIQFADLSALQQSINGPINPLHKSDKDQTLDMLRGYKDGAMMGAELLSRLDAIRQDQKKLQYEYQVLDRLFEQVEFSLDYDQTMHGDRDRYSDILTYKKSAVQLQRGITSDSHKFDSYINACYMNSPMCDGGDQVGDGKIIASQGPLPQTTENFWQMILEQNVTMVVSTCKTVELGRKKCNQFWPDDAAHPRSYNVSIAQEDYNVQVKLLEQVQESKNLVRRELEALRPDGSKQNVTQIHFMGWPDHGIPNTQESVNDFESMLNYFIEWNLKSARDQRAIVHCSAGIGRTGTTITLTHVIIKLMAQRNAGVKDPLFSILHTVRRIREHRFGSVQTESQYIFIYQFLANWLRKYWK